MADLKRPLGILLRFRQVAVIFVIIILFFSFYNLFLVDHTLEDLRFSLEQTALAYSVDEINGLDMVINKTLSEEMPYSRVETKDFANLEYAKKIAATGTGFRQLDNVKVALKASVAEREKKRGTFLSILDRINNPIRKNIGQMAHLYSRLISPSSVQAPSPAAQVNLFDQIAVLEKEIDLQKAAEGYKELIRKYPNNDKTPLAKLRLAYVYQRLGQNDIAINGYKEIIEKYPGYREADIAKICLSRLMEKDTLLGQIDSLILKYNNTPRSEVDARQEMAYNIGRLYTKLLNLDDAIKFLKRAVDINPSSDIAIKSQIAIAWLYRQRNDFNRSADILEKLVVEKPKSDLIDDLYSQIADTYHYQGKYEKSIELLQKLAEAYRNKDPELASLYLFQAGASYMYDLNDTEKAQEIFRQLSKQYPKSPYAKYVSPESPLGVFVTYLVPRATRVVTWRMMGLLCISGYVGELCKFRATTDENGFNMSFNDWLRKELPDTLGNLYVEIRGQKTIFEPGRATSQGMITMGKFKVEGSADWKLAISQGKMLNFMILKAFLDKIPIPPILINRSLIGMERIIEKNIPVELTGLDMKNGSIVVEGVGTRGMLGDIQKSTNKLFMTDFEVESIKDPVEAQKITASFKEKFPEADFSPVLKNDNEDLFIDFFTRMSLFLSFRILETVKDSKFDYERSIRTLGQLIITKGNFKIDLKKDDIISELSTYIKYEFPWLVGNDFLIDVKGIGLDFKNNGDINFDVAVALSYGGMTGSPNGLKVKGTMRFEIDKESGIPKWVFKEVSIDDKPFPVEKLNMVSSRCFNILKDDRIPIVFEEIKPYEGGIVFKGKGARDFVTRLFSDPHLFIIFQIRQADLDIAGIQRIKRFDKADTEGAYYRGKLQKTYKDTDLNPAVKQYIR